MSAKWVSLLTTLALLSPAASVPAQLPPMQPELKRAPAQLVVNVPATRLDLLLEGALIRSYRVTVGSPAFPTPTGEFEITDITWNPWWIPPPSPWAAKEKAQPPGARNPMGRVKLRFAGTYFLHGTADVSNLGRAASHGCIRLSNADAQELARNVVELAGTWIAPQLLDSLLTNPRKTQRTDLDCRVPLTIRYDLAEVRDTVLHLYRDVYRRGADVRTEALAALARAGFTAADLRLDRLELALNEKKPLPRTVPLHTIVQPAVWQRMRIRMATQ